ncbi:hypothetical protein Tco_1571638 [Tanacetum coccineum]
MQNLLPNLLGQVGNQGSNQGNVKNQNGEAVNDNIHGDVRNVIVKKDRRGCTYKEFLACNPKEYDGKGCAIANARWIEKMELHELARLVPHLVTFENKRIERTLRNVKDDNKRSRTGNTFTITANPPRREYTVATALGILLRTVEWYLGWLNQAQRPNGGHSNQVVAIDGGQGHRNNGNRSHGGVFMLGAEEARQDPNIVMDTFTLNNHYATTLFNSGTDYNFVSTALTPLLGI